MTKKLLGKIFIPITILGILIAPISPTLTLSNSKINLEFKENKVEAVTGDCYFEINNVKIINLASDGATVSADLYVRKPADMEATEIRRSTNLDDFNNIFAGIAGAIVLGGAPIILGQTNTTVGCSLSIAEDLVIEDGSANDWNLVLDQDIEPDPITKKFYLPEGYFKVEVSANNNFTSGAVDVINIKDIDLKAQKQTKIITHNTELAQSHLKNSKELYFRYVLITEGILKKNIYSPTFKINLPSNGTSIGESSQETTNIEYPIAALTCGINNIAGCVAQFLQGIWQATSYIAELAGRFLDFLIYYSIDSDSYRTDFVTKSWGIIRDITNILFIITLLYIAIKTILNINVSNNKKLISALVVVALIINFSLFFTQVVIDSSNILAKVFYNNIETTKKGQVGTEAEGEKSISVALVSKFNPQEMVSGEFINKSIGFYIFIILLSIAIMLYLAWILFIIAFLFIGRVIMLWISMIFSPISFVSYAVPFNIPYFGHKEWWKELLSNAFMAPIFIFFLYIIILFLDIGIKFTYSGDLNTQTAYGTMRNIMNVVIPFAMLFLLLKTAKDLTIKLSGKLGEGFSKIGKKIGGAAVGLTLGAVTGGAALAARGTIGALGSTIKNNEKIKNAAATKKGFTGWASRMAIKGADKTSKASFDARNIGMVNTLAGKAGFNLNSGAKFVGLGAKQGGHDALIQKKISDKEKELELYKTKMTDSEVAEWNRKRDANGKGIRDKEGNLIVKADDLNNYRMNEYKEKIGKDDLISALSFTMANNWVDKIKKEDIENATTARAESEFEAKNKIKPLSQEEIEQRAYFIYQERLKTGAPGNENTDLANAQRELEEERANKHEEEKRGFVQEEISKEIKNAEIARNAKVNKAADNIKLIPGIPMGIAGAAIGGIAYPALKLETDKIISGSLKGALEKQTQGFENLGKRLTDLSETLKELEENKIAGKSKFGNLYDGNKLNKTSFNDAVSEREIKISDFMQQLEALNKRNATPADKQKVMDSLLLQKKEINMLKDLKETEDKIFSVQQQIYNAKGVNVKSASKAMNSTSTSSSSNTSTSTSGKP